MENKLLGKIVAGCFLIISSYAQASVPSVPSLSGPSTSSTGNYSVSWSSSGATRYVLQGESSGILSNNSSTSISRNKSNGTYYYKVKACFNQWSSSCSAYSPKLKVVVDIPPPPPVNHWPVAHSDTMTVRENDSSATCKSVLSNDTDSDGDTLSLTNVWSAPNGTSSKSGNQACYKPNLNFSGVDTFKYTIKDPSGLTDTETVTVTIAPNGEPRAIDDTITLEEINEETCIPVLENDWDPDEDNLTIYAVWSVPNGSARISGNSICYTPDSDFSGVDDFDYSIKDGRGKTASANVSVTITNDSPRAIDDNETIVLENSDATCINVLDNDWDPDNDTLTIYSVWSVANGSAVINDNKICYTPDTGFSGVDDFDYSIRDGRGKTASANVSVTVQSLPSIPLLSIMELSRINQDPNNNEIDEKQNELDDSGNIIDNDMKYRVTWSPSFDSQGNPATHYQLTDSNDGLITCVDEIETSCTPNILSNGIYSYKVRACNEYDCSMDSPLISVNVLKPSTNILESITVDDPHWNDTPISTCNKYPCIKSATFDGKTTNRIGGKLSILGENEFEFSPRSTDVKDCLRESGSPSKKNLCQRAEFVHTSKFFEDMGINKRIHRFVMSPVISTISDNQFDWLIIFQDIHKLVAKDDNELFCGRNDVGTPFSMCKNTELNISCDSRPCSSNSSLFLAHIKHEMDWVEITDKYTGITTQVFKNVGKEVGKVYLSDLSLPISVEIIKDGNHQGEGIVTISLNGKIIGSDELNMPTDNHKYHVKNSEGYHDYTIGMYHNYDYKSKYDKADEDKCKVDKVESGENPSTCEGIDKKTIKGSFKLELSNIEFEKILEN